MCKMSAEFFYFLADSLCTLFEYTNLVILYYCLQYQVIWVCLFVGNGSGDGNVLDTNLCMGTAVRWGLTSLLFCFVLFCFVLFCFVWFGLVWFGLVWFGLVWFGFVWFRFVLFCLVWFGLVWFCFGLFRFCFDFVLVWFWFVLVVFS